MALLLEVIAARAASLLGVDDDEFLDWLDGITPGEISGDAGTASTGSRARLADSVDELDGLLLSAIEEINRAEALDMDGAAAEAHLVDLWQKTFTNVAAVQEAWMEAAFIRRGRALIETVYPDAAERKRLYQYGFTPYVGQRFEEIAPEIRTLIEGATNYGEAADEDRLAIFEEIGELLAADRGFGFRVRDTVTDQRLLENWSDVLRWWMQGPEAGQPDATCS